MENTMLSRQARWACGGVLALLAVLVFCAAPAAAITWGEKDDTGKYPNVGMILVHDPNVDVVYQWCSGTLIAPRVFLTAGHCTFFLPAYLNADLIDHIYVSFDVEPFAVGHTWLEVDQVITHPDFSFKPRSNWHDNGVLVLTEAVSGITPAALPDEGFLDRLQAGGELGHGTNGAKFTVVGYGASLSFPPPRTYSEDVRQFALSEYRALLPAWLRLSQQGRTGNGGTCYGDSGGPTFWQEPNGDLIVVATTTWGDMPCVTSGFNQRLDVPSSLDFISSEVLQHP
jgi:secreted trypsin-like serine protease